MPNDEEKIDDVVDVEVDETGEALDTAIDDGEDAALKDNPKFEKERQRADQEAANARKARELASQRETELNAAKTEADQLRNQLKEAEAKAAKAGIDDVELKEDEYEGSDLVLVKAIKAINKQLEAKDTEIKELQTVRKTYEENARKSQAESNRNAQYEELLTELDGEYGADCRNAAVKKFNELAADGQVPKGNPAKATLIMTRCYKEAKAAKVKAAKDNPSLSLDTGAGGGAAPKLSGSKLKPGSLDEVAAQAAKMKTPSS